MLPTACTARRATSWTRTRSSPGSRPKAAAGQTTRGCKEIPLSAGSRPSWTCGPSLAYAGHMPRETAMGPERHVKLFKNGRNQAVRIPREFEFSGEEAIMRKEGERLILEPAPPKSLLAVLATLAPLDEDFPPIPDLPPDPVDL